MEGQDAPSLYDSLLDQLQSSKTPPHLQSPSATSLNDATMEPDNMSSPETFTVPIHPLKPHKIITNHHLHSIDQFAEDLSAALSAAWPTRHESRYRDVQVLILSWEDDDLGVSKEIDDLRSTFLHLFHYGVTEWKIPQHKPERKLNLEVGDFLEQYDSKDRLLVVYYAGHGFLNEQRVPMWAAYVFRLPFGLLVARLTSPQEYGSFQPNASVQLNTVSIRRG